MKITLNMRERGYGERIVGGVGLIILCMIFLFFFVLGGTELAFGAYLAFGVIVSGTLTLMTYREKKILAIFWRIMLLFPLVFISERITNWMRIGQTANGGRYKIEIKKEKEVYNVENGS